MSRIPHVKNSHNYTSLPSSLPPSTWTDRINRGSSGLGGMCNTIDRDRTQQQQTKSAERYSRDHTRSTKTSQSRVGPKPHRKRWWPISWHAKRRKNPLLILTLASNWQKHIALSMTTAEASGNTSGQKKTHGQCSLIVPSVTTINLQQYANRKMQVIANRLQFGRCRLNAYLHQINRHATGLCDTCAVPETVQHYVMECDNEITKQVKVFCQTQKLEHTLAKVLSNGEAIRIICRESKRAI